MELNASSDPSTATFGNSSEDGNGLAIAAPALAIMGPAGPGDDGASSAGSDGASRAASMATAVSA
eukprot:11583193-Alexandrium_andersonii.AAC.1